MLEPVDCVQVIESYNFFFYPVVKYWNGWLLL